MIDETQVKHGPSSTRPPEDGGPQARGVGRAVSSSRALRSLAIIVALFAVPLGVAYVLRDVVGWSPAGHVNHGQLIEPARTLPEVTLPSIKGGEPVANPFMGHWSLVHVDSGHCDEKCQYALYVMHDIRIDLGRNLSRVHGVYLVTGGACCDHVLTERRDPRLTVLDASGSAARKLVDTFPGGDLDATIFIVDPLGNLMMRYDSRHEPMGLLEDLQRLLRLSQIG